MINLQEVCKSYRLGGRTVHALDKVSLQIPQGDFVAIVGPSGSGKSTLLNVLGCLDTPDSGSYHFGGSDLTHAPDPQLAQLRNRSIGFVFQSFHLIERLSTQQNVEQPMLYLGAGRLDRRARRTRSLALLAQVGLADRAQHKPTQLSGGQQQRVALARALANDPDVIIADEPTGNLDSVTAEAILSLLHAEHQRGKTLILVTHDNALAAQALRTVRMLDGRIIPVGH